MTDRPRTVEKRVSDWLRAYQAVAAELTPQAFREMTSLAKVLPGQAIDPASIQLGITIARVVFANDRAAGLIAASLTASGVKIESVDDELA